MTKKFGWKENHLDKNVKYCEQTAKENEENINKGKQIESKCREDFISELQRGKVPHKDIEKYCKEKFGY